MRACRRLALLGLAVLGLPGMAGPGRAQSPPRQLPPPSSIQLDARSFDVRGFDPLGLADAPAMAGAPPGGDATLLPRSGEAHAELAPRDGLFSDGWSRDGFARPPRPAPSHF